MSAPDLTVIIVSFNTRDLLCDCLRSLRRVALEVAIERIVIDNASADGSADAVAAQFPEVTLIHSPVNRGFAAAMNLGLHAAKAPLVLALNPDTIVVPGTLTRMRHFLDQHPDAVVAGAGLTNPDGTAQPSTFRFPGLWREFWNFLPELKFLLKPRRLHYGVHGYSLRKPVRKAHRVDSVSGAAFMAHADTIQQAGGFDEEFFLYHEEMDLFRRIQKLGGEIWTVPDAQVIHFDAMSSGFKPQVFPSGRLLNWRILGMDYLWHKHKSKTQHYLWRLQARLLLWLRISAIRVGLLFKKRENDRKRQRIRELRDLIRALKRSPTAIRST